MSIDKWAATHNVKPRARSITEQLAPIEEEVIYACIHYLPRDVRRWLLEEFEIKVGDTSLRDWYKERKPDDRSGQDRPMGS